MLHGSGTPWCSRRATAFPASLVSLRGCRVLHRPLGLHHPLHVATALTSPASVPLVHRTAALGLLVLTILVVLFACGLVLGSFVQPASHVQTLQCALCRAVKLSDGDRGFRSRIRNSVLTHTSSMVPASPGSSFFHG